LPVPPAVREKGSGLSARRGSIARPLRSFAPALDNRVDQEDKQCRLHPHPNAASTQASTSGSVATTQPWWSSKNTPSLIGANSGSAPVSRATGLRTPHGLCQRTRPPGNPYPDSLDCYVDRHSHQTPETVVAPVVDLLRRAQLGCRIFPMTIPGGGAYDPRTGSVPRALRPKTSKPPENFQTTGHSDGQHDDLTMASRSPSGPVPATTDGPAVTCCILRESRPAASLVVCLRASLDL
jgi:hypothetical protein